MLKGRIAQVSIEKLLRYADRLGPETRIAIGKASCQAANPTIDRPRWRGNVLAIAKKTHFGFTIISWIEAE